MYYIDNYDLEFDSIYTQPRRYDSLCPDQTEYFTVTTIFHQWHKDLWLQAYDPMGRMVYQQMARPEEKKLELNVSSWQPGMYYFRLVYGDTMVASEKIIVQ